MSGKTLYDKIFDAHIVDFDKATGEYLIYIDRHLIHEVTSPQAFDGLRIRGIGVRCPNKVIAVADHNTPTKKQESIDKIEDDVSKNQLQTLDKNVKEFGIKNYHPMCEKNNGIIHVVAPEIGFAQPATTIVCGDSHTSTHGAFGALSFGIGTSQVEQVFATQTLKVKKNKNMRITINGKLKPNVFAKDVILYVISKIGTGGGTGYTIEFAGDVIKNLSVEGRMTICNMAIEAGARSGIIAPDEKVFEYFRNKKYCNIAVKDYNKTADFEKNDEFFNKKVAYWKQFYTDTDAVFDKAFTFNGDDIEPQITWGTSPEDSISIYDKVPKATSESKQKALEYIGLSVDENIADVEFSNVFIGSCTNGRIEDLREVARALDDIEKYTGKPAKVSEKITAIVVPGSNVVKFQAEREGIADKIIKAGFEWRNPGCSMCLGMNEDKLPPYARCASTSNRNFEGRQGYLSRTHLCSPRTATIIAVFGKIDLDFINWCKENKF
ncbi:MAG: 3-isopropylmalate dehydratase large subunit [Rickettsiales bacterium]|nr:3-isopropylmalate dehydratase large subunit [Rickettsiales bacterium]